MICKWLAREKRELPNEDEICVLLLAHVSHSHPFWRSSLRFSPGRSVAGVNRAALVPLVADARARLLFTCVLPWPSRRPSSRLLSLIYPSRTATNVR